MRAICVPAIRLALPACLSLLLACDSKPSAHTPAPADSPVAGATPAAGTAREIYIDSVIPGNPLVVMGRARTFENTVQVRVLDSAGAPVTEDFTTSVGETGSHNPYEARAWLVRDPGSTITVEAFEYSAKDGSVRSLVSQPLPLGGPRRTLRVMFPAADCTTTSTFERTVPRTLSVAQLLARILIAGPTEAERRRGATGPFPPGSRVNDVTLRDGTLTVDFNERLQNVGGSCAAQAIRAAVTATLAALPGVQRVRITAAGNEELALQP